MTVRGLVDYHLHTATSADGHATVAEYCARADTLGLSEIAITNHMNLRDARYHLTPATLCEVEKEIRTCRSAYPHLSVRLGIEVDYFDDLEETLAELLPEYAEAVGGRLDFVMGAVHVMRGVRFASKKTAHILLEGADPLPIFRDYFDLSVRAVRSGLFDVIAHPDLIKRFSGLHNPTVPFDAYEEEALALVGALVECDVGIEVNVKGLTHPIGEIYPSRRFLSHYVKAARAAGREPTVVLGTDAHRPEQLGMYLDRGADLLHSADLHEITTFDQRRRISYALADGTDTKARGEGE